MTSTTTPPDSWPRWRLVAILTAVTATALTLLVGLGLALWPLLNATPTPTVTSPSPAPRAVRGTAYRDRIATDPMLQVPAAAASTPEVSTTLAPTLLVPTSNTLGPAGVTTGFPHTPAGAVAQLAAIEVPVVQAISIPVALEVHDAWALPGGVSGASWAMTRNVQVFLTTLAQQGHAMDGTVLVTATPAAGMVKGVDGPDWVLACVLLDVHASVVTLAEIGYGHCEPMAWHDSRWMIAPGTPPAEAPSVWPGSDLALKAGWRTWATTPPGHGG